MKEVIVSFRFSEGSARALEFRAVKPRVARNEDGSLSLLTLPVSSWTKKKGRLPVVYPIVQFDPTRTQSDARSPNGWMNGGKGFKVLALVVKSVVCCRSCFLCAIDVPRRTLF